MRGIAGSGASIMSLRVGSFMRFAPWLAANCRIEHEGEPPFSSLMTHDLDWLIGLHIKLTNELAIKVASERLVRTAKAGTSQGWVSRDGSSEHAERRRKRHMARHCDKRVPV